MLVSWRVSILRKISKSFPDGFFRIQFCHQFPKHGSARWLAKIMWGQGCFKWKMASGPQDALLSCPGSKCLLACFFGVSQVTNQMFISQSPMIQISSDNAALEQWTTKTPCDIPCTSWLIGILTYTVYIWVVLPHAINFQHRLRSLLTTHLLYTGGFIGVRLTFQDVRLNKN